MTILLFCLQVELKIVKILQFIYYIFLILEFQVHAGWFLWKYSPIPKEVQKIPLAMHMFISIQQVQTQHLAMCIWVYSL
jgi:hypothetical protein